MGRHKTARRRWTQDETADLLAHLDHIVAKRRQNGNFSKAIVLRMLQSSMKHRTIAQIESKLTSICRADGGHLEKKIHDIYKLGTIVLRDMDADTRSKVQKHLAIIKDREMSKILVTPRLRSQSRTVEPESSMHTIREMNPGRNLWPGKKMSRGTCDIHADRGQVKKEDHGFKDCDQSCEAHTVSGSSPLLESYITVSIAESEQCTDLGQDSEPDREPMGNETQATVENINSRIASQYTLEELQRRKDAIEKFNDPNLARQPVNESFALHNREMLEDLFEDSMFYRQKSSRLEERLARLEECHNLVSSIGPVTADSARTTETIEAMKRRILDLMYQSNKQRSLQKFLELAKDEHAPLVPETLKSNFSKIRCYMEVLSIPKNFSYPDHRVRVEELTDLSTLLRKSLGYGEPTCAYASIPEDIKSSFSVITLVQSLIGAAICEWVFDDELQVLTVTTCPLLEEYKQNLRSLCGEVALRNLDIAAHRSLADQDSFQNIHLPRRAERLADRLLAALDPFFRVKGAHKRRSELKECLESIFLSALNIKIETLVSKDVFETTWSLPRSLFRGSVMQPMKHSTSKEASKTHAQRVKLTLIPGICAYSCDKKLVDHCSFALGGKPSLGKPAQIFRTVVVL